VAKSGKTVNEVDLDGSFFDYDLFFFFFFFLLFPIFEFRSPDAA